MQFCGNTLPNDVCCRYAPPAEGPADGRSTGIYVNDAALRIQKRCATAANIQWKNVDGSDCSIPRKRNRFHYFLFHGNYCC